MLTTERNDTLFKSQSWPLTLQKCLQIARYFLVLTELSVGPTVFRGLRNFEPSRGICPLPRNFNSSAEFEKRPVISRIVGVMISLIACHLHFLSSEHFGCWVETLRFRMTDILNISHHSFQLTHGIYELWVSLHFWKEKKLVFLCCYVIT